MKKVLCIGILFLACAAAPFGAAAQASEREALIAELEMLLGQLIAIQIELQKSEQPRVLGVSTTHLQPSTYFNGEYDAIYIVDGAALNPYDDTVPTQSDIRYWNILRDVMGDSAISDYISEFRLYNDRDAAYDAFVEQQGESDDWIFGVNVAIDGFDTSFRNEIATELFIHEYAHILHHYHYSAAKQFEELFWDRRSHNEGDDFVTAYAMESVSEDFAESFTYFVLDPRPNSISIADQKIAFFYDYDVFREIRKDMWGRLFE